MKTVIYNGTVWLTDDNGKVTGKVISEDESFVRYTPIGVRSRAMSLSILSILAVIALILAVASLIWQQYPLLQVSVILICVGLLVANK